MPVLGYLDELVLVPLGIGWLVMGLRPCDMGLQVGNWRSGLKWVFAIYGVFLPVVVAVSWRRFEPSALMTNTW